jgi:hypothetical protein
MKPERMWVLAPIVVLTATVALNIYVLWAASDPAASAIEPDYYRKAVAWDSTLAARARGAALGWSLEARLGAPRAAGVPVRVEIRDAGGRRLAGATVRLEAIHNLEGQAPVRSSLRERRAGEYETLLPAHRAGLWELRFDVRRDGDRFGVTLRRDTEPA